MFLLKLNYVENNNLTIRGIKLCGKEIESENEKDYGN